MNHCIMTMNIHEFKQLTCPLRKENHSVVTKLNYFKPLSFLSLGQTNEDVKGII